MSPSQPCPPSIAIALVNYCARDLTVDCLRSLEPEVALWPGCEVVVADNASPDGSGAEIAKAIQDSGWSHWARVLALPKNGGFSYGNNGIIREQLARTDAPVYIWLLNTDTIVRPGALRALIEFMEMHPNAGFAGSGLEFPDATRQCSAFRFHSIGSEFEGSVNLGIITRLMKSSVVAPRLSGQGGRYDWLSGASMLTRTSVFHDVGLMDEDYFLYYEETDFCRRALAHGWTCWYVPESRVIHLVGKSTGVTDVASRGKRRARYWFQSRRRYFLKHHGLVYATLADLALAVGTAFSLLRHVIERRPSAVPQHFLWDLARESAVLNPGSMPSGADPSISDRCRQ